MNKITTTQYIEFLKKWNKREENEFKYLRYGQAFVNFMAMECEVRPPPEQTQRLFYTTDIEETLKLVFTWVDWEKT